MLACRKRKRPAAAPAVEPMSTDERSKLERELVQCTTQTGLVQAMTALKVYGVLQDNLVDFKPAQLRGDLVKAKKNPQRPEDGVWASRAKHACACEEDNHLGVL